MWLIAWWHLRYVYDDATPTAPDFYLNYVYSAILPQEPYQELCLRWACFLSCSVKPNFMEDVTCASQEFPCSHILSFYCAHRFEFIITRKYFSIVLCLNIPKINYLMSDSWSLNQYQGPSHVESDFLLASSGSRLCWLRCLQRPHTLVGGKSW